MERVAQETMDKAVTYQTELENARLSGQKQVSLGDVAVHHDGSETLVEAFVGRGKSYSRVVPALFHNEPMRLVRSRASRVLLAGVDLDARR